jgi:hypothetical protein
MKRLVLFFIVAAACLAQPPRSVYVMPMAGGLDQYLASQITRDKVLQVVADPKLADAVLTDRLGEAFEQKLAQIHPRDDDGETTDSPHHSFQSTGAKGTVFLVDTKSRQVLWSDFEKPPTKRSIANLSKQAARIVKRLQGNTTK